MAKLSPQEVTQEVLKELARRVPAMLATRESQWRRVTLHINPEGTAVRIEWPPETKTIGGSDRADDR